MLLVVITAISAMALTYLMNRTHKADSSKLSEPRHGLLAVGVQIICGNCSGDGDRAVKTYLSRAGNCAQCGGTSYILASDLAWRAHNALATRRQRYEAVAGSGRVLPFNLPLASGE
jgi:hypothetical protein